MPRLRGCGGGRVMDIHCADPMCDGDHTFPGQSCLSQPTDDPHLWPEFEVPC
jgi:hypothetical protein